LPIPFDDLAAYLKHGREIEFSYKGKHYSITNSRYEWHFCCDTDETTAALCAYPEFDVLVDQVRHFKIEGVCIEEIFCKHPEEFIVLAIL